MLFGCLILPLPRLSSGSRIAAGCKVKKLGGGNNLRKVFLGSSKGGYSALNFAFLLPNAYVVIGAPQYYLGTYLDTEKTKDNLAYIIGDISEDGIDMLNNRLRKRIHSSSIQPQKVYLHYSKAEHTYNDHVKDLIEDLRSVGIDLEEDIHDYPSHGGLKDFFPRFLTSTIRNIISV